MKNKRLSGLSSEMVRAAGKAGVDMITDLANQIIVVEELLQQLGNIELL